MSITIDINQIGSYTRLRDNSVKVDTPASRLNENPRLYGDLKNKQLDLSKGSDNFRDEGYGDVFFSFSNYLKSKFPSGTLLKDAVDADFISTRQNLTLIAKSAFDTKKLVVIRALRKNGVIFLCNTASENEKPYSGYGCGFGYKFEQYMTLNENGKPYGENEGVSNAECWKAVLRTTFKSETGAVKVLYAAETDAVDRDGKFCEMKTSAYSPQSWLSDQSLHHYLQCYLGGVSFFVKGHKNKRFIDEVEKIDVSSIPGMGVTWRPADCLTRLFKVLQEVKEKLTEDGKALKIKIGNGGVTYESENGNDCHFVNQQLLDYFN
uniref:Decapping nuclease n=1 Tax=Caenorhabditis tropicalis TaxID=1561998 RepID=A0A1I7T2R5_9PELO